MNKNIELDTLKNLLYCTISSQAASFSNMRKVQRPGFLPVPVSTGKCEKSNYGLRYGLFSYESMSSFNRGFMAICANQDCMNEVLKPTNKYCSRRCCCANAGKVSHKKHPGRTSELLKQTHKNNPGLAHNNGTKTMSLYASEFAKRLHEINPNHCKDNVRFGGKYVQELHPDLSRNNMIKANKTIHANKVDGLTPIELLLWNNQEFRDLNPIKQYVIPLQVSNRKNTRYVCDFLVNDKYIIELDGNYHDLNAQKIHDTKREQFLLDNGYIVLRYKNDEVLSNISSVVASIKAAIN